MRLTPSPIQAANTIARIQAMMESGVERAPGTHVSDLIFCLRKTKARAEGVMPALSPSDTLVFSVGRAIQDYVTGGAPEAAFEMDGIHGTVDWVDEGGYPWEVKATYASASKDPRQTPHYFDQLAAYCRMAGVTKGYLAVFYINGGYDKKGPAGERAVLKVWEVAFDVSDLEVHWQRLRERAALWREAGRWDDLPLSEHWTWECNYCPLKGRGCPGGRGDYTDSWGPS